MKIRSVTFLLSLVLLLAVFVPFTSLAEEADYDEKDYQKAVQIIDNANEKILSLVEHAQQTKKDDVDKLITQTDSIIEKATEKVERLGFEVECTYDIYIVDGQEVKIDPLYVINPRPTTDIN